MSNFLSTILIISTAINTGVHCNSNTVAITHSSYSNNYSNKVDVIKSEPQADKEYITSFYKRVREKHRANFGRQLESHAQSTQFENNQSGNLQQQHCSEHGSDGSHSHYYHEDHSLDHYFDHQLSSSSPNKHNHHRHKKAAEVTSSSPSDAARSVRGGGAGAGTKLVHKPSFVAKAKQNIWSPNGGGNKYESRSYIQAGDQSNHYHQHSLEDEEQSDSDEDYDYDEYDDEEDLQPSTYDHGNEGDDDFPPNEHHLGLLRVPCSIAVNSGEATQHYASSSHDDTDKTPMAAFVDTGAQVTIISASAAKRAGIYHLMDRRYAGRATGVGQCKILGRIPARHVYFLLGEEREEQEFDDDECPTDYRGGGQEHQYYHDDDGLSVSSNRNGMIQMDGPALTVLEGTVTQGVDILLGLDVLQDWDAEIRMGPRKSITVNKRRGSADGGGRSVVIPFASSSAANSYRRRHTPRRRDDGSSRHHRHNHHHKPPSTTSHYDYDDLELSDFEDEARDMSYNDVYDEEVEDDDDDFSPTASDIESDLDLLDQSGHEFPEERRRGTGTSLQDLEDEMLSTINTSRNMDMDDVYDEEDDEDCWMNGVNDEDGIISDDQFDMAGL